METPPIVERYNVERAKAAYRAYGATTNFLNFQGNPMPEWDALPEKIRAAWVAASDAATDFDVVEQVRQETLENVVVP